MSFYKSKFIIEALKLPDSNEKGLSSVLPPLSKDPGIASLTCFYIIIFNKKIFWMLCLYFYWRKLFIHISFVLASHYDCFCPRQVIISSFQRWFPHGSVVSPLAMLMCKVLKYPLATFRCFKIFGISSVFSWIYCMAASPQALQSYQVSFSCSLLSKSRFRAPLLFYWWIAKFPWDSESFLNFLFYLWALSHCLPFSIRDLKLSNMRKDLHISREQHIKVDEQKMLILLSPSSPCIP